MILLQIGKHPVLSWDPWAEIIRVTAHPSATFFSKSLNCLFIWSIVKSMSLRSEYLFWIKNSVPLVFKLHLISVLAKSILYACLYTNEIEKAWDNC